MEAKTRVYDSTIFGPTRDATEQEVAAIDKHVADTPVAVFQSLNRLMNARGLCIAIDVLPPGEPTQ
jgi:hypothetical protein